MNQGKVRVGDVCHLAGDRQVRLPMSERIARKGPYPLYAENCMPFGIDDYAIEAGGTVMVSALGQVLTSAGTLVAKLEPGRCSASEHVHALIPHDPSDAAFLWRVLTTTPSAAYHVSGTSQLRQLGASALVSMPIPWPEKAARDAFVAALDEHDREHARLSELIPQIYAQADEAYAVQVAATSEGRVRVSDVCRIARGTDVPAAERAADKAVRIEGPSGGLGRCDEVLCGEPAVMVGPSGRRLLSHYVDEPTHPIAEMAFVTQGSCDVELPLLLFALRHAGLPDRLRVGGELVGLAGLTMEDLPGIELALGTPEVRAAFAPKAAQAARELCDTQRALAALAKTRAELIRSFFADIDYEHAELPTPRGTTVYPAALGAAKVAPETPAVGSDPELDPLGPIVREQSFGLAPDDVAWELAPLAVLRACLDEDAWQDIARAAAVEGAPGLMGALDAAMGALAETDDLLSFLPNLSYESSLLSPAQLAVWVGLLDGVERETITGTCVRAAFSLAPMSRALPSAVGTVLAGALRGVAAAILDAGGDEDACADEADDANADADEAEGAGVAEDAEGAEDAAEDADGTEAPWEELGALDTAYVPYEADGCVIDTLATVLPDVTLRAQFEDFPHMLAGAMVRAVELCHARETRGGLGAAAGSALAADEFADWVAPLVCAALPPNAGQWCTSAPAADDPRWVLGTPPRNKANFAWLQMALSHQASGGATVLLMCNAPLHSTAGSEPGLRRTLVEQGRVRCVVALPPAIFGDERPPMSLLVLGDAGCADEILFVDALGEGADVGGASLNACPRRTLPDGIACAIADMCEAWLARGERPARLEDGAPGIPACIASLDEVRTAGYTLAPWVYAPAR